MKIINRTILRTKALEEMARYAHRFVDRRGKASKLERLTVRFYWKRRVNRDSSGGAVLGGLYLEVGIGKPLDPAKIIRTLDHELHHIYGWTHEDMGPSAVGDAYHSAENLERFAAARRMW